MVRLLTRFSPGPDPQRHVQGCGDRPRDLLLNGEDVGELAVVILGPDMRAVVGLDELRGDAHAVAGLAHRAFDEMRGVQRLPDRSHVAGSRP